MTAAHADRIRAQLATEKCPDFAAVDAADHARMARLRGAC